MGSFITNVSLNLLVKYFLIAEHLPKLQAKWWIVSYASFTLDFCPQRCRTRRISKITCVLRTETVTDYCYVNRHINVSLLSTNIKLRKTSFDLLTDRLTPVSDWPTAEHLRHFAATSFSLLQQLCTVDSGIFLYGWCERLFRSELNNEYFTRHIF